MERVKWIRYKKKKLRLNYDIMIKKTKMKKKAIMC